MSSGLADRKVILIVHRRPSTSITTRFVETVLKLQAQNTTTNPNIHSSSSSEPPVNLLDSMYDLGHIVSRQPVDLLKMRTSSAALRSNVENSAGVATHLRSLADSVEAVFDQMRELHGKGRVEIGVLFDEVNESFFCLRIPSRS